MELLPLLHLLSIILICVRNWLFCAVAQAVARSQPGRSWSWGWSWSCSWGVSQTPNCVCTEIFPWLEFWLWPPLSIYTYFARRWLGQKLPRLGSGSSSSSISRDFGNSLGLMVALLLWREISTRMPQLNNLTRLGASSFWLELAAKKVFSTKGGLINERGQQGSWGAGNTWRTYIFTQHLVLGWKNCRHIN